MPEQTSPKILNYIPQILGFFLSANAGAINAVSLLQPVKVGVSHATGSLSHLSMQLALGGVHLVELAGIIVSFILGAFFSGLALGGGQFDPHKRYGLVLMAEALLIFTSYFIFLVHHPLGGLFPLAFACGIQNGLFTSYYKAVIRTTHMTGVLTDLGLALGKGFQDGHWDLTNLGLYLSLLAGFIVGGVSGVMIWAQVGLDVLLGNAIYTLAMGIAYFGFRRHHFSR